MASGAPQLRHRSPRMRPAGSRAASVAAGVARSMAMTDDPFRVGGRTGNEKDPSTRKGPQGIALSRRRSCPELAPCRLCAGRLSWLQRAGPSATLDSALQLARWYEAGRTTVKADLDVRSRRGGGLRAVGLVRRGRGCWVGLRGRVARWLVDVQQV